MSEDKNIRGIDRNQEIDPRTLWRQVKPMRQRFKEAMEKPESLLFGMGGIAACMVVFPVLNELFFLLGLWLLYYTGTQKFVLPYRLPQLSLLPDYSDLHPVSKKPNKASGISFLGNERNEALPKELWFNSSDMRTHVLIFGSTGSGKTEALLGFAYNAMVQGSGLIYVDGKGENALFIKIFAMARTLGREDDVLLVNYMTGSRDVFGPQESKLSNTLNPFSSGSSSALTELLVSLMDDSGGEGGMWKGRAVSLISAIMMALVFMRENKEILLDVDVIREYLILDNIIKLYKQRRDLPKHVRESLRAYLTSLPGFQENAPKQNDTALEQHGYLQMQFTRLLGSLADQYGYIFRTNLGEVDFWDVVANRRILVVLLPALEKSQDELGNLGKIIVACLKQMMSAGLGNKMEGDYRDIVEVKPTLSLSPFMCILDEYGYYAVKGAAVMPAQARSLGFSMVFAGQDYPAFEKASKEEAASTIANCNIKIFMKLEDPKDTYELFEKSVGEAYVTQVSGFQGNPGALFSQYTGMQNANAELRKRGNLRDLQEQENGDAHIIFKGGLVRAKMFAPLAANPPKPKQVRLNYFLRVEPPDIKDIQMQDAGLLELRERLLSNEFVDQIYQANLQATDEPARIASFMQKAMASGVLPHEAACWALARQSSEMQGVLDGNLRAMEELVEAPIVEDEHRKINIFSDGTMEDEDSPGQSSFANVQSRQRQAMPSAMPVSRDDDDDEEGPEDPSEDDDLNIFLNEQATRKNIEDIERAVGVPAAQAQESSEKAVDDMRRLSEYPASGGPDEKEPEEIMDILKELDDEFGKPDDD